MPRPKGTYKSPQYLIPLGLLELSNPYIKERKTDVRAYGRQAIYLLNYMSEHELNHTSAQLILPTSSMPLLNISRRQKPESYTRRPIRMHMPNEQVELMERFAREDNITTTERAVRAYRFANFIAEYVHPGDRLLFENQATHTVFEATDIFK